MLSHISKKFWQLVFKFTLFLQELYTAESKFPSGQPNSAGPHLGKSNRHVSSYVSLHHHLSIVRKPGYYLIKYVKHTFSKNWVSLSSFTKATKKRFK